MLVTLLLLLMTCFIGLYIWYRSWLSYHTVAVSADSHVVDTAQGQVEYDLRGSGQVILHFHGGNVGHNGWFMLEHLIDAGYQLLTPDRPGYLGTPVNDNGSPDAQAKLMHALLDTLNIERVCVIGVSAGGPSALEFAIRYPDRVTCLILQSAVTKQTQLTDDQLNSTLGKLVMTRNLQNPAYFLIYQAMTYLPQLSLQDFVKTETTYSQDEGKQIIEQITDDPHQRKHVQTLANAMIPALPRFDGVMNDLNVQQTLDDLPLETVQVPTLIIHSERDGDVPYENATYAHQKIPDAELITVQQFGHFIWWGDPTVTASFQKRVEAFIREHGSIDETS